jgi:hypothetical protein
VKLKLDHAVLTAALAGVGVCAGAVVHFLLLIYNNGLGWSEDWKARDHYLAVGNSYTEGFVVGFFFCFSLAIFAAVLTRRQDPTGRAAAAEQRLHIVTTRSGEESRPA